MYAHSSITLNQHEVSVRSILEKTYQPQTEFEKNTVAFMHAWLLGQQFFALRTSGSTGTPKEITFSREQMVASATATLKVLRVEQNSMALVCLPTQYVAGIMMLVRALMGNLRIVAVEPTANPFKNFRSNVFIDFAALVPYQVEGILAASQGNGIDSIKKLIIGGAPVSALLQQKLATITSAVYQTYGMTETLSHVALQKISGTDRQNFFTLLPNVSIDKDNRDCLIIKTNYLPEPIVTNDRVELLSANTFRWLGRVDNVINSGGIKLQPESIEQKIRALFLERNIENDFFVQGLPDAALGTQAVLVVEGSVPLNDNALLQELASHLTKYEMPKRVLHAINFVRTETGKVKRAETVAAL